MKLFTFVFVLVKVALLAKAQSDADLLETSENEVYALFKVNLSKFFSFDRKCLIMFNLFVCDSVDGNGWNDCRIRICAKLCITTAKLRRYLFVTIRTNTKAFLSVYSRLTNLHFFILAPSYAPSAPASYAAPKGTFSHSLLSFQLFAWSFKVHMWSLIFFFSITYIVL